MLFVFAGSSTAALVAGSEPVIVTVAPTMTAPLGSTTVTCKAPEVVVCARARGKNGLSHNAPPSTTRIVGTSRRAPIISGPRTFADRWSR